MKRIEIVIKSGDTESPTGADDLHTALRELAHELTAPGMVGGEREVGGFVIAWNVEVTP